MAKRLTYVFAVLWNISRLASGVDLFVSQFNGNDTVSCGNVLTPCASLEYSLKHIAKSNDIIRLDAGTRKGKPFTYAFNRTMPYINKNLTITNYDETLPRPIVVWKETVQRDQYMLHVGSKITFQISNINFINMPLIALEQSVNLILLIRKCGFIGSNKAVIRNFIKMACNVNINISQCSFYGTNIISFSSNCTGKVSFQHCVIEGVPTMDRMMTLSIVSVHLTIGHCYFFNTSGYPVFMSILQQSEEGFNRLTIKHTVFKNMLAGRLKASLVARQLHEVLIDNCSFSGFLKSAVSIETTSYFLVKNTIFKQNKGVQGGALYIQQSSGVIDHCLFEKNFANVGGAIYNRGLRSSVYVRNSKFISNTANGIGGNVYFSQENKKDFPSTMSLINVNVIGDAVSNINYGYFMYSVARISLTNVTVTLKSSLSKADVIDGLLCTEACLENFSNFNNLQLTCAKNYIATYLPAKVSKNSSLSSLRCYKCPRGTYSFILQTIKANILPDRSVYNVTKNYMECKECPTGGICESGIISKGNFWGFKTHINEIVFLSCPSEYCCSYKTNKCLSYNTCNANREGILCSSCKRGYRLNYFNEHCVKASNCKKGLFWTFFALYGIFYAVMFLYYKDLIILILKAFKKTKTKIMSRRTVTSLNEPADDEDSSDDVIIPNEESDTEREWLEECVTRPTVTPDTDAVTENSLKTLISGIKTILFFFYQMEILISIEHHLNNTGYGYLSKLKTILSSLTNLQYISIGISLCPSEGLTTIGKELTQLALIFVAMCVLFLPVIFKCTFKFLRKRKQQDGEKFRETLPFSARARITFIHLLLLSYTSLSAFCFKMTNCVEINKKHHLHIQGDVSCYTWWHYSMITFISIWIVPFPVSTYLSSQLLQSNQISLIKFYVIFLFPPTALINYVLTKYCSKKREFSPGMVNSIEKDSIIALFTGSYRTEKETGTGINWEVTILFRRFVLTALCVYIINPVSRMLILLPILLMFILHHLYILPFCTPLLNRMETVSLSLLLYLGVADLFWAINYMNDLTKMPAHQVISVALSWTEDIILTFPLLLLLFGLAYVSFKKIAIFLLR